MDGILLAGIDIEMISRRKLWLQQNLEMKFMGEASYVLSIRITRDCWGKENMLGSRKINTCSLEKVSYRKLYKQSTPVVKHVYLSNTQASKSKRDQGDV